MNFYIKQKIFSWGDQFFIYDQNGNERYRVKGDFFDHSYEVSDSAGRTLATVSKEWFTLGDAYELSLSDGVDEIAVLAVCLVIDACIEVQNN